MHYLDEYIQNLPSHEHWKRVGAFPHHGICVMLSSLHTKKSCGIGEFYDLFPLITWLTNIHMDILQLLPINDTDQDVSPYNAISANALNPVYISLWALQGVEDDLSLQEQISSLRNEKNPTYQTVRAKKEQFLWEYFHKYFSHYQKSQEFQTFLHENAWVEEFGIFTGLRKENKRKIWKKWTKYSNPTDQELLELSKTYEEEINYTALVQFLAYQQMANVKKDAQEHGIFLMGDIPILLSVDSVDAWFYQEQFSFSKQAGAPPDMYNAKGQLWGFPLFRWDIMKQNQYQWWKTRLKSASALYHIYRIDHVVGFFRIWGIDNNKQPSEGAFISPNRYLWPFEGKERLSMLLSSTTMLPIAEDLGTIPKEVHPIMKELGICGTKVMRWHRKWKLDSSYYLSSEYDPLSLCTVSTHDSETLQQWWEKYPQEAAYFAGSRGITYSTKLTPDLRWQLLVDAHHTTSLFHVNLLQEYLALFPELISSNQDRERINIPGELNKTNWTYKVKFPLEELFSYPGFSKAMAELIYKEDINMLVK